MSPASDLPLPPGRFGLPFLGELPLFLKDGFGFVEERARRHGPIFRTRILGRPTAVITGPDASGKFIDHGIIQRSGAMPLHIETLFGGRCLPLLDGNDHHERKSFVMEAFSREALASYVPVIARIVRSYVARWSGAGELRWLDELKRLSLETVCSTIMGMEAGPQLDRVAADYERVFGGFAALPIPLPGTAYSRAKRALGRIFDVFDADVHRHLEQPRDDGLSRILAKKSPVSGRNIGIEEAKTELHHIAVAGLIVWAWLVTAVTELERDPVLHSRLAGEIGIVAPNGIASLEMVESMGLLGRVTSEIRRLSPVVQVLFGKARESFDFAGHRVPAGWMVLWGIRSSHLDPAVYPDPTRFDPERFAPERAEHLRHEHAFVPNGAGTAHGHHKCAGYELGPLFLQIFMVELLRGATWSFAPGQDMTLDFRRVPPAPRDGLRATIRAKT